MTGRNYLPVPTFSYEGGRFYNFLYGNPEKPNHQEIRFL
ncbi:Uncharacterized protein dnm_065220 [Desulfonema magnum]|uniref:Uncharacterized protein n=1 Tax=Desulfonema magnum TaxID=45655 RepID=A0A975GQW9_9BACT|nr:Uncharacterized protein dnm_065220 [Desulfonema magnum]